MTRWLAALLATLTAAAITGCPEPYPDPDQNQAPSTPGVTSVYVSSSPSGGRIHVSDSSGGPWSASEWSTPARFGFNWNKLDSSVSMIWLRVKFADGRWSQPRSVRRNESSSTLSFSPQESTAPTSAEGADVDEAWTSEDP